MATQTGTVLSGPVFASKGRSSTAALTSPSEPVRPYKDFLTPALHRRFTHSALLLLSACYLESILIRSPSLFWFWNPFSVTGIRTLLLFLPCLAVFIVRLTNMHTGKIATTSAAESIYCILTSFSTVYTLGWYLWSAWIFSEIYIWSRAPEAHLMWVDVGQAYERARLNENPIFLRSFLCCLAVIQTLLHLARDYDRISLAREERKANSDEPTSRIPASIQEMMAYLPTIGRRVLMLDFPGLVFWIPVYFALVRYLIWPYFYIVGRALNRDLPPEGKPTGIGIENVFYFVWQCLSSAAMLGFLWELSNAAFTIYVTQPPLKKEQPLTSEVKDAQGAVISSSKDPNASLLVGLKSKKVVVKSFAFWELWLICSQYADRRISIYTEVDRKDGSTWSQITKCCLDEIEAIKGRINQANMPPHAQKENEEKKQQGSNGMQQERDVSGMPKIADRKILDGDVWQKPSRSDFVHNVGDIAKSFGQSPNASSPLGPSARRAIEWSRDHVLSKEDQDRLSREGLAREANSTILQLLRTPLGMPFRQTYARATCDVLFGRPYSNKNNIILASRSLVSLAVHSINEDKYGQNAKSVAPIIRAFTSTITAVDKFVATRAPHWTDVEFSPTDKVIPDVVELLAELRTGLEQMLLAFGEYVSDIGLSKVDYRQAKEASVPLGR